MASDYGVSIIEPIIKARYAQEFILHWHMQILKSRLRGYSCKADCYFCRQQTKAKG